MIFYIGACLILDGLTNLISLICIQVKVKKLAKIQREHPEVQLKDLLEQEEKKSTGDSDMVPTEVSKTDNRQE